MIFPSVWTIHGCCWCHCVQGPTFRNTKNGLNQRRRRTSGHCSRCHDTRVGAILHCDCEVDSFCFSNSAGLYFACYLYIEHTNNIDRRIANRNCLDIDFLGWAIENSIRGVTDASTYSARVSICGVEAVCKFGNLLDICSSCINIIVCLEDWSL